MGKTYRIAVELPDDRLFYLTTDNKVVPENEVGEGAQKFVNRLTALDVAGRLRKSYASRKIKCRVLVDDGGKRRARPPSYNAGVHYVAFNDEPTIMNADDLMGMPTTHLLSLLFAKPMETVARDIIACRRRAESVRE